MGQQDRLAPGGADVVQGAGQPPDAGIVADFAVLDGNIDVHPHQHPFAAQIHVIQRVPAHVVTSKSNAFNRRVVAPDLRPTSMRHLAIGGPRHR